MTTIFFKYFHSKPKSEIGTGKPNDQKYFTSDPFDSSLKAKEFLSIPYEPFYQLQIIPQIDDIWNDLWEEIDGGKGEKIRRVWAAFGLHGGAWEMVTSKIFSEGSDKTSLGLTDAGRWSINKTLYSGGYKEKYSTFIEPTEHGKLLDLLKEFLIEYTQDGNNGNLKAPEKGNFKWKIYDDVLGGAQYWRDLDSCIEYTISVLIKEHENIYNGIKLWGAFWKDNNLNWTRTIYKPLEVIIPSFPLIGNDELDQYSFKSFLRCRFDDIRKTLSTKGKLFTENKNKPTDSYDFQLPSPKDWAITQINNDSHYY